MRIQLSVPVAAMFKRLVRLVQIMAVSAATACSAAPASPPGPAIPPSAPAPAATATAIATTMPVATQPVDEKRRGGVLTIGSTEEPDTLHPLLTQLTVSSHIVEGVFDSLLDYDPDQKLQPSLAQSYSVSSDGLIYTFNLRKGVKWHDGEPFTSADVKATWQIINDEAFASFITTGWDMVKSIDTPDDYTVVMKTDKIFAPFLSAVAPTPIVPKHLIDKGLDFFKQDFGRNPIGTGPFKFLKWDAAQSVQLAKNAEYWGGEPYLDKIVFKIVPDINTLVIQLKTGDVQMTDNLSPALLDQIRSDPKFNLELRNGTDWQHIDLKQWGFLTDKRVRQALDYAVPKQLIVDSLLKGLGIVATGDQVPGTQWADDQIQPRPYDLDKAAQLLEEAGFKKGRDGVLRKNGVPFALEYWTASNDEVVKQMQEAIASSWRKLGIDVDTRQEDSNALFGPNGYQFTKKMTAGQYAWNNSNDPDDRFFWHSSEIPAEPTGTGGNTLGYFKRFSFQKKIDALTEAGVEELDPAKRAGIYKQIQALLHDEVPVIFLYWGKKIYITPKTLAGFVPNPYNYLLYGAKDWAFTR